MLAHASAFLTPQTDLTSWVYVPFSRSSLLLNLHLIPTGPILLLHPNTIKRPTPRQPLNQLRNPDCLCAIRFFIGGVGQSIKATKQP
jgi:hypothetical protein